MSPAIRLGDNDEGPIDAPPADPINRLHRSRPTIGGIETRAVSCRGEGTPALLLHGWLDNADTWLEALDLLAAENVPAIAYDQPGFGVAPPLDPEGDVLDQLVDFAGRAVLHAAEAAGRGVIVVGNSLGGWTALRLAQHSELPIAGVVAVAPAGIRMAPLFFGADRIPAVRRILAAPAPVPEGVVRTVAGNLYRRLAFGDSRGIEQSVVDRFTRFTTDRAVLAERIEYAKRLRPSLGDPFDPERIQLPVTVLWGDNDRLCVPEGADVLQEFLPHARIELLEGIGHTPQIECPEVVVGAIAELAD